MSSLEAIQFEVGLTKDPKILKQLKINRMWREDEYGPFLSIQFDAQEFKFRPGKTFIVGKTVGNALIRSSAVLLGKDPLSDPYVAYVIKLAESQLGQERKVVPGASGPQFACPICHEDQKTGPRLARHLMDKKAHEGIEVKVDPNDVDDEDENVDAFDGVDEVESESALQVETKEGE